MATIKKIRPISRFDNLTVDDITNDTCVNNFRARDRTIGYIRGYTRKYVAKVFTNDSGGKTIYLHDTNDKRQRRNRNCVAFVDLDKVPDGKKLYSVSMLSVDKEHSGQNLALKMYKLIVKKLGWVIIAGDKQTTGSRKLWYNLAQEPGVCVFTQDPITNEFVLCDVNHDVCELRVGELSPYRNYSKYHMGNRIYLSNNKSL